LQKSYAYWPTFQLLTEQLNEQLKALSGKQSRWLHGWYQAQNEVVQVKYQRRGRLSLSSTRDEYGSFAIEAKIRKKF
jgi:hypothetical protein